MAAPSPSVVVNGILSNEISALSRGLAYGDGLFETIRVSQGKIPLWQLHLSRLQKGLRHLGMECEHQRILNQLETTLKSVDDLERQDYVLKMIVCREVGGRGYAPSSAKSDLISYLAPLAPSSYAETGVSVHWCQERLPEPVSWAGLKTLNQLSYVLASKERQGTECAEGLLCSPAGHVIEATARNVFIVKDGQLYTPSLNTCGVSGIMRQLLVETIAPQLTLTTHERPIPLAELELADEVFLSNSVTGIWPVVKCEQNQWPVGAITKELQKAVQAFVNHNNSLAFDQ